VGKCSEWGKETPHERGSCPHHPEKARERRRTGEGKQGDLRVCTASQEKKEGFCIGAIREDNSPNRARDWQRLSFEKGVRRKKKKCRSEGGGGTVGQPKGGDKLAKSGRTWGDVPPKEKRGMGEEGANYA